MIPQGQAVSRLSGYYRETAVLPPAGLGNMDVWEKYDLEEKSGAAYYLSATSVVCIKYYFKLMHQIHSRKQH